MKKVLKGSLRILLYLLIFIIVQVLCVAVFGWAGYREMATGVNFSEASDLAVFIDDVYAWLLQKATLLTFVSDAVLFLSFLGILSLRKISLKKRLGSGKMTLRNLLAVAYILCGAGVLVNLMVELPVFMPYMEDYDALMEEIVGGNPWLTALTVCIFGPLVEEFYFRTVLYKEFRSFAPVWLSALLSALLFGLAHGNLVQGTYTAAFGVVLALAYEKTDTFWVPFLLHVAFNLSSFLPGFGENLSGTVLLIGGIICLCAGWMLLEKKKN